MRSVCVLITLLSLSWGQRYVKFRPSVPLGPLSTQEYPRLLEPKPIQPVIIMPPELQVLYEKYLSEQRQRQLVPGYRIQVLGTTEKAVADSARFYLLETYPELPVYVTYEVPIYRVRVGDFVDKAEANRWLEILRYEFRGAFIVPDQVMKP
jgi:hypothetical protein